ncbi:MAG: class I SAM-dependent methyltransferase [Deltaproteobacteria bacterium]|nr:class I SAM-dependent methyltransferase [Deltaproteobacteria bacterium]
MTPSTLHHLAAHHGDFDQFAALMQQTASGRFNEVFWGVWRQYVAPALPETGRVVDLGCGPGGLFAPLRARHPDVALIGVEVQPAMLREARAVAVHVRAEILEADLNLPLPLADACADAVTLAHVLHELPWPVPLLREALRILRPGGACLVFDWVRQPLQSYVEGAELDENLLQHFREHCLYTPDDLAFLCQRAGFEVREIIGRRGGRFAMIALARPALAEPT